MQKLVIFNLLNSPEYIMLLDMAQYYKISNFIKIQGLLILKIFNLQTMEE